MDASRRAILTELDKNIFVIAGAGSGKTTVLVNRMVAMVESGIDISNICAITFTVNAAARFLVDFQKALKKRSVTPDNYKGNSSELEGSSPQKREYCIKALENIDLCFAGTIDSFCQRILGEIPYDAGIPSSTALLTDDAAAKFHKKIFKEISNNPAGLENEYNDFIKLHSNPAQVFAKTIQKIKDLTVLNLIHNENTKTLDMAFNDFKKKYIDNLSNDIDSLLNMESYSLDNSDKGKYKDAFNAFKKSVKSYINNLSISNASSNFSKIKILLSELAFTVDPELDYLSFGLTKGV